MDILYFVVAFLSSIVGAICGIGGGVVIKLVLDMLQMGAPATINFLSGCTVLSMSLYSVSKALRSGDSNVEMSTGTPLAMGAAVCKEMFSAVKAFFNGSPMVVFRQWRWVLLPWELCCIPSKEIKRECENVPQIGTLEAVKCLE